MSTTLTPEEALIFAMVTTAAIDRRITEDELKRIETIVKDLPPFHAYDAGWFQREAQACGRLLAGPSGVDRVLDQIRTALPPQLAETAYVLAAEVAATDLKVKVEEVQFLDMLADRLQLDRLVCAALARAAKARHQAVG
jgi:uncharacterized membrane protein YebE (DUF533 family)